MKITIRSSLIFAVVTALSTTLSAATDPLIGTWKTIDDRTGYSLADVVISKDHNDHYQAKIIQVHGMPGATPKKLCSNCQGELKNHPLIGLTLLEGLTSHPSKADEYSNGVLLDPISGQHYPTKARLKNKGKHLAIHSRLEGSMVGRNMTWIRY